jgi:hypothetical protein
VRQVGIAGFLLLVVAGTLAGVGYAVNLPRPVVLLGVICLAIGVVAAFGAAYANARRDNETIARSIGRSIKDTMRLVFDLVP